MKDDAGHYGIFKRPSPHAKKTGATKTVKLLATSTSRWVSIAVFIPHKEWSLVSIRSSAMLISLGRYLGELYSLTHGNEW